VKYIFKVKTLKMLLNVTKFYINEKNINNEKNIFKGKNIVTELKFFIYI